MILALALSPALDVTYLLPRVEVGGIHRPHEVLRLAGGKALNLARAARELGTAVRVVAPLGGHVGALVAEGARAAGIELQAVDTGIETRSCVTAIADSGDPTEFYEPAAPLRAGDWEQLARQLAEAPTAGWTALSGSIPGTGSTERTAALSALGGMLERRQRRGDRLAVDSHGPVMHFLLHARRPELVKVNRGEAAELLAGIAPDGADALRLARELREITGGTAVVTDGAAGAVAVDAAGAWRAHPDPEPGRFAVGSGDSFLAGLLTVLDSGGALRDALALASAAGSANTRRPGAALFSPADLDAARSRIEVHAL